MPEGEEARHAAELEALRAIVREGLLPVVTPGVQDHTYEALGFTLGEHVPADHPRLALRRVTLPTGWSYWFGSERGPLYLLDELDRPRAQVNYRLGYVRRASMRLFMPHAYLDWCVARDREVITDEAFCPVEYVRKLARQRYRDNMLDADFWTAPTHDGVPTEPNLQYAEEKTAVAEKWERLLKQFGGYAVDRKPKTVRSMM